MSDVYNFENIAYHVYRPTDVEIAPVQSDPVTTTGNTLSLESDFGIFLNQNGRRTRPKELFPPQTNPIDPSALPPRL